MLAGLAEGKAVSFVTHRKLPLIWPLLTRGLRRAKQGFMARPRRRKGFRPEIVQLVGQLPLCRGAHPAGVVFLTIKAYFNELATSPPDNVTVLKLVIAGVASQGHGGKLAVPRQTKGGRYRHPAAIGPWQLVNSLWQFQQGLGTCDYDTLKQIEGYAHWGLEAYGYVTSPAKCGRPSSTPSLENLRMAIARRHHQLKSKRISLEKVIWQIARETVLNRKIGAGATSGSEKQKLALEDGDAEAELQEFRRLEKAYYRSPMTPAQVVGYRRHAAMLLYAMRRVSKRRVDFCQETRPAVRP